MNVREKLITAFPGLSSTQFEVVSPVEPLYNCIAFAAGDTQRFWWPFEKGYWPAEIPRELTLMAFVAVFAELGYEPGFADELERGIEKVALYAEGGVIPKHAARQLSDGTWASKLGRDVDITHPLHALEGDMYGVVIQILGRRRPTR